MTKFQLITQFEADNDRDAEVFAALVERVMKQIKGLEVLDDGILLSRASLLKMPPQEWITYADPIKGLSQLGLTTQLRQSLERATEFEDVEEMDL